MKKIKIFIGTRETSGYFGALKEGFRNLGYYCKFYDLYSHNFSYNLDDNKKSLIVRLLINYIEKIEKNKIKGITKLFYTILAYLFSFIFFVKVCFEFNVFIFYSYSGFWRLKPWDYSVLKFLRKKIIFVSLGTDIRPPYLNGKYISNKRYSINSIYFETKKLINKIKRMEKVTDIIISYPAHSQLLNNKFINGLIIGNPAEITIKKEEEKKDIIIELEKDKIGQKNIDQNIIKILHAPSDPASKGTFEIREIIKKLIEKGYKIEYIEVTKQPHHVIIEKIIECDFVIDQLYSDTPLPLFSVEAGLLKKPSVVCGYYSKYLKEDIEKDIFNFPLFVDPDECISIVEKLCKSKEYREEMGNQVYDFLINNWSKEKVAEKYIKIILNEFSDSWFYDPLNIKYFYGYGIKKNELLPFLRNFNEKYNKDIFFLSKNESLIKRIIKEISDI